MGITFQSSQLKECVHLRKKVILSLFLTQVKECVRIEIDFDFGEIYRHLSLVYTVPVYALVRHDSLKPADRGEEDDSRKNSSAFIYLRQCYGPAPVCGKIGHGLSRLCYGLRR